MANDLGTISILVDVRGQPIVKDLAKDLNNVATSEKQVSAATQKVMADFQRMQAITAMLKKTTDDTSNSFQRFSVKELQQATQRMQGFESVLVNTRHKMGQMGMATQQIGYQVGDFLVQVQSGTNVLVAFGQQATQLVGILPSFSRQLGVSVGSLIGISSVLGIAIPLVTAIGAAFMRTSSEASSSSKSIDAYSEALKGLQTSLKETQLEIDKLSFNTEDAAMASALKALAEAEVTLAQARANQRRIGNAIAPTTEQAAALKEAVVKYNQMAAAVREVEARNAALAEAQRMINGGLSVAASIQRGLASDKMAELSLAKEQAIEEAKAEDLARRKKDAFHAMAGEMGAVSSAMFSANDGAASILSNLVGATNAAMSLRDALGKVESAAASRADRIASLTAQIAAVQRGAYASVAQAQAETAAQLSRTGASLDQIAAAAQNAGEQAKEIEKLEGSLKDLTKTSGGAAKGLKEAEKAAEQLKAQLEAPLVNAVGSISDAFGDFVARGLKDFKGFVQSILGSFQNMIAQMIAMAVKNRIMLSLGIGGITPTMAAAGQVAGLGSAGGMLGSLGAGAGFAGIAGGTGLLGGLGNAISMPLFGGGGAGLFSVGANAAAAGGGIMASIGAAIPALAAVAAVFSFFTKKTTELDSGLRITVKNMDALVKSFQKIQTKKFWGLSTSTSTTVETVSTEVSDPIVQAVQDIQTQVIKAAKMFDVSSSAFKNFVYKMEISLKGLTEEEKIQKVNEEIMKMGDAFTTLSGKFTSMNELLAAAQERYDLTTRLLALQGKGERLLARQRKLELAAVNDLNKALLLQIYALEDVQIAAQKTADATSNLRAAMDRQLADAAGAVGTARDALEKAINKRINSIRTKMEKVVSSLEKGLDVASRKADASRKIFEILDSALKDRSLVTPGKEFASRNAALSYVSGGGTDADKLTSALDTLNQPSQQLFGSFQDYARDFAKTTNAIKESRDLAEATMTADERMVSLLEKQIEDARAQAEARIQEFESLLAVDEEVLTVQQALSEYLAAQATYEQVQQQHEELVAQFPMLNESILSVAQAIKLLRKAIREQTAATQAADEATATTSTSSRAARVPAFANGGLHSGGIRLVGEKGPEIENTGPSRIFSSNQTAGMFRDPDLKDAVRSLKEEVSGLRSEQRQIQMDISKYTKRSYDIERKWDVEGLPATRT